jgi:hypothetical protein
MRYPGILQILACLHPQVMIALSECKSYRRPVLSARLTKQSSWTRERDMQRYAPASKGEAASVNGSARTSALRSTSSF